jgi:hypothetical protein
MLGDVEESHRALCDRQQPAFHRRDRHAGDGVGVDDRGEIDADPPLRLADLRADA